MRSRANRRLWWERAARGSALALVGLALLRIVLAQGERSTPASHRAPVVHLTLAGIVGPRARDSLAAHARAGDAVTWSGDLAAVATALEPTRDPAARTRITAVSDGALVLVDSLGDIDSLPRGGGVVIASGLRGAVRVSDGRTVASAAPSMGTTSGRVLVLGHVGWESKFTIAALEEAGWSVDAQLQLSNTMRLTQGSAGAPAIGVYAVVVALDTVLGAEAAVLSRFVRAGGGLVLSGEAAAAATFSAMTPARGGARVEGSRGGFDGSDPLLALPIRSLTAVRADAVVLERRGGAIAVVARRVEAGRVVQSAYEESWRWRMQGGASGLREHREWWTRLVAAAAPSVRASGTAASASGGGETSVLNDAEAAPRATLVHRLGPAVLHAPNRSPEPRQLHPWLGAVAIALLLAEWASRRARGAA